MRKVHAAVLQVGDHAARRGDHDVRTHQHPAFLGVPALAVAAAIDHRRRDGQIIRETLELLVDLLRQLARGHDDDRFHHIVGIAPDEQLVQQRQRIGRRLARSGLGAADDVAALQNHGNRVLLHGSHFMEIHILETVEDLILQVEFVKTHKSVILIVKNSLSPLSFPFRRTIRDRPAAETDGPPQFTRPPGPPRRAASRACSP